MHLFDYAFLRNSSLHVQIIVISNEYSLACDTMQLHFFVVEFVICIVIVSSLQIIINVNYNARGCWKELHVRYENLNSATAPFWFALLCWLWMLTLLLDNYLKWQTIPFIVILIPQCFFNQHCCYWTLVFFTSLICEDLDSRAGTDTHVLEHAC